MERLDITKAVKAISSVLPKRRSIGHHEPYQSECELKHLKTFLEKGVTNTDYDQWFIEKLKLLTGAEQCMLVANGTAALHLALMAVGVKAGDEVLVPSLTYAATANAVSHAGAIPNFIDGKICLNPFKLQQYLEREFHVAENHEGLINKSTHRPVTALIMVHLLGYPCNTPDIRRITQRYGLKLVEDAAEALGSCAENTPCGSKGDVSILSFNHNKIITTSGGGALLTDDPFILAKAHHLAHQGRRPHYWVVDHDILGWNYAMPSICSALGVAQLERFNEILARKRMLHEKYVDVLLDIKGLKLLAHLEGSNCWMTTVLTDYAEDRELLLQALHNEGILARQLFKPLHTLPFYADNPRDDMGYCLNTYSRAVCLPSGAGLI